MEHLNNIDSRETLIAYLNSVGAFWEYQNKADQNTPDKEIIFKALLFLEFEDMEQLFELFPREQCKKIFEEQIENQKGYYDIIAHLLRYYFFTPVQYANV